jgi:glycosyltransferase involved in cell wall biosynthesis
MKISVIIPVYNCEKYLNKCLNSVLEQTLDDFELILVNNGSLDDSAQICAKYADLDSRIRYFLRENSGSAAEPRNRGLEEARGEYIVFVDGDDYLEPDALETLYTEAVSMDYDCVIAGYTNYSDDGVVDFDVIPDGQEYMSSTEVKQYFARTYPNGEAGYLWNKIYKRDIIEHFEIRFPSYARLEDGFFNVAYFSHVDKLKILPKVTYHYKTNAQTELFRKSPSNYYDLIEALTEHYYETIAGWGLEAADYEQEMVRFFLNETEICFENTKNPAWEMDHKACKAYLSELRGRQRMQEMLPKRKETGKYVRRVMGLFARRQYRAMMAAVRFKMYAKRYMKGFFGMVKRVFN